MIDITLTLRGTIAESSIYEKEKTLVNARSDKVVKAFIEELPYKVRKSDALVLLEIMKEITGKEHHICGVGIMGFGQYIY